jgi:heme/copper-type cytochrome/quinol oxidase subunit 1
MMSLVRRFLKTAIVFLGVGILLGGWMMVQRELWDKYPPPYEVSAHTHAILVGFVMLMILGVAQWMFPRPVKGDTRYSPRLAEASYWLVTVGTGGRVVGELMRGASSAWWLRVAVLLTGAAQIAGLGAFFFNMWSRIRPVGSQSREASGERF